MKNTPTFASTVYCTLLIAYTREGTTTTTKGDNSSRQSGTKYVRPQDSARGGKEKDKAVTEAVANKGKWRPYREPREKPSPALK